MGATFLQNDLESLWQGVFGVQASVSRHVDKIDVTTFGDLHPKYVAGMTHENARVEIDCDGRAMHLLMRVLATAPQYDAERDEVVLRVAAADLAKAGFAPAKKNEPILPLEQAQVRLITLED